MQSAGMVSICKMVFAWGLFLGEYSYRNINFYHKISTLKFCFPPRLRENGATFFIC
jgi:hypothetical protein